MFWMGIVLYVYRDFRTEGWLGVIVRIDQADATQSLFVEVDCPQLSLIWGETGGIVEVIDELDAPADVGIAFEEIDEVRRHFECSPLIGLVVEENFF